ALYQPLVAAMARDGFVIAQLGQSLDGRIATEDGHSHYINGPESLEFDPRTGITYIANKDADQILARHQAVKRRWDEPLAPYGVQLIPMTRVAGASCQPAIEGGVRADGRRKAKAAATG
ncbi:MAG TPA: dihydrofolate reductase family protein, partial [Rubrivivax sp.]|nr:dihydrofolate reductase family protein [Rubrivivax sp.]